MQNINLRMAENKRVLPRPDEDWVDRLEVGALVYLVKEGEFAIIEMPLFQEGMGSIGLICISRFTDNHFIGFEKWYVSTKGNGLDGRPIMSPVVGYLPERSNDSFTKSELEQRVQKLERKVQELEKLTVPLQHHVGYNADVVADSPLLARQFKSIYELI